MEEDEVRGDVLEVVRDIRMRLCFFYDDITHTGGIERVISLLCAQFTTSHRDLDIEIVSQFRSSKTLAYDFPGTKITYLSEKNYDAKPHSPQRMFRILGNVLNVRKHFKKNKYDVIVGQAYPNMILLYLAGVSLKNVVAAEHVYYGYYGSLLQKLRLHIYKKCSKVVVLTSKDKECYDKFFPSEHTCVIPNPVVLTETYTSPLDSKTIVAIGRIQYQKGFDTLVDVFNRVHEKYPDWIVKIYGDGNLRKELEQQISNSGLNGVVNLMGRTNEIYKKLREAAFFVLSSRFEGFSMVLVEAQSQGVPAVSFDCPNGPSDIIENGVNGILVENQNKDALYDGISYMIEHPEQRKSMGKKAVENVGRFSSVVICNMWKKLFEGIVG